MLGPISARILAAPSCLIPGTVCNSLNACSKLRPLRTQEDFGVNLLQLLFEKREMFKAELDQHS